MVSASGATDLEHFADFDGWRDYNGDMPNWLTDTVAAWRGQNSREPQSFSVRCSCGQAVVGVRTESNQNVTCPGCKTSLFVLPACVYPLPRAAKKRPQATVPAPVEKSLPSRPVTKSRAPSPLPQAETSAERRQAVPAEPAPKPGLPLRRPRKIVTPLRVVLLGLASVVFATLWWMIHLKSLGQAEQTLTEAVKLGEQALLEEDLDEAARQFERAHAALGVLGRQDALSQTIRQRARELTALGQLASRSLHEIAAEAEELETAGRRSDWPDTFRLTHRDAWVVLDATVTGVTAAGERKKYVIEFPISAGSASAHVVGNLPVFDRLPAEPPSQRVIFAAQLADCRRAADAGGGWEFVLGEETAFLWCTPGNFRLLAGTIDAETEKQLAVQSRLMGLEP